MTGLVVLLSVVCAMLIVESISLLRSTNKWEKSFNEYVERTRVLLEELINLNVDLEDTCEKQKELIEELQKELDKKNNTKLFVEKLEERYSEIESPYDYEYSVASD